MTSFEKAELLKSTIEQLYSKEGRSISYISRLLEINRKTLSTKIHEWNLPEAEPRYHPTPSSVKFVNKNRQFIKAQLDKNVSISEIARQLNVSRHMLYRTAIVHDSVLKKAHEDYIHRIESGAEERRQRLMDKSPMEYNPEDLPGEEWKPILGYDGYMISNMGRVKSYATRYKSYHLLKSQINPLHNRPQIILYKDGKRKILSLSRLVGFAFVDGFSEQRNTINHIDGVTTNCVASNLEWVSQSDNNKHSYRVLNRQKVYGKKLHFQKIVYNEKYEFKTVSALARFMGKSPTQVRRYLETPEKYGLKLVG